MQVNSINSTNFGNSYGSKFRQSNDLPSREELSNLSEKISKIKANVRPETIIAGAAIMYGAFKKGKNIVPYVRKFAVTSGEYIAKGAVKVADTVAQYSKKIFSKSKNFNSFYEKASQSINNWASNSRNTEYTDLKLFNGIKEVSSKMLGDEKAQKVIEFMQNNGLTNKSKLLDAALATAIGYKAADGITDVIENTADGIQIQNEIKKMDPLSKIVDLAS